MANIKEDYVSYETAKLMKNSGFDCDEISCINVFKGHTYKVQGTVIDVDEDVTIPTIQMAMKWLREVYNIIIEVSPLSFSFKSSESFICDNWVFNLWENGNPIVSEFYGNQTAYPTYEEACESAIKCGLENLIENV